MLLAIPAARGGFDCDVFASKSGEWTFWVRNRSMLEEIARTFDLALVIL